MTVTSETETRIDQRIARLAKGRRAATARAELKDHILQAAEEIAAGRRVTNADIDAAFATLGDDATIRETFFPGAPRVALKPTDITVLIAAAVVVGIGGFASGQGAATCTVADGGTCTATSGGHVADMLIMASAPLVALAARRWLPAWVGLGGSILYTTFVILRAGNIVDAGEAIATLTELLAAVAMLYVTGHHLVQQRRAMAASRPTA